MLVSQLFCGDGRGAHGPNNTDEQKQVLTADIRQVEVVDQGRKQKRVHQEQAENHSVVPTKLLKFSSRVSKRRNSGQ